MLERKTFAPIIEKRKVYFHLKASMFKLSKIGVALCAVMEQEKIIIGIKLQF